jgi:hypothetical protein
MQSDTVLTLMQILKEQFKEKKSLPQMIDQMTMTKELQLKLLRMMMMIIEIMSID